jgi:ribosomal protein L11 methyltransferase
VWAVDYDPQALQASEANAARNGVSAKVRVCAPADREPAGPARGTVRVLVANILAGPLQTLAGRFAEHLAPGGTVVLAGILAEQVHGVMRAYEHWFTMEHRRSREEWALLVGCRREE